MLHADVDIGNRFGNRLLIRRAGKLIDEPVHRFVKIIVSMSVDECFEASA